MNPAEKKRIIAKIAKCMALGQSPEPHEAAAALRRARELMEKYQLSEAEVRLADIQERKVTAGRAAATPPAWLAALARVVGLAFGVDRFYSPEYRRVSAYVFVGIDPAATIAEYTFTVLRRKCEAARATYYKTRRGSRSGRTARADAYAAGWVGAVDAKVRAFAKQTPQVVGEYLQHYHPDLTTLCPINRAMNEDLTHALAGFLDGQGVELQHGVGGQVVRQVGG